MSKIDEVISSVDAVFSRLNAPCWPDPHAGRRADEEEYGRVTDPGRFRALTLRLAAWRKYLTGNWGVEVEGPTQSGATLASLWTSPRPSTLALRVTVSRTGELSWVQLAIGADPVGFGSLPECACDACDRGSAALLADLDALVISVLTGNLVVVVGPRTEGGPGPGFLIVATGEDWSLEGEGPAETAEIVDAVRSGDDPQLPAGSVVRHGRAWLD